MEVVVRPDVDAAVDLVARLIAARIEAKPDLVIGLATGRTMERVYDRLVALGPSFRRVCSFNLDEYVGLAPDDPQSYRSYMRQHLFDRVDIDLANARLPEVDGPDLKEVARRYEADIAAAGGVDLQLLGIGETGHIGFNEPLSALMSRTRDKTLTQDTRRQNAAMFGGDPDRVPSRALTMGVGTILDAREVLLLATGEHKAHIVAKAIEGPITSMVTASALQLHPNCKVVLDEAAAEALQGRDYYDWVFQSEPDWDDFR
ncbi:glucosamine-6-phosphate deaminase [Rubellimicrobium aerolatum]|uniref:Glucosamine-6-phosphate deaminase n=1 Tax=Rubellimicrobium aerolatum TaxID=490979 RepID=A0ABW0SEQ2_9RHOB|nr:glucosamine-6-phosphate deaminase [Rubellimicrobium aerolatum]MBP1806939.1 glucosamine-6-phosphate deaminase [Rubellimicrobium aerolatum]